MIEASWGLGEAVVAGLVVRDRFVLTTAGRITHRSIGEKDIAVRGDPAGGTREAPIASALVNAPCVTDAQLLELHALAAACERHFGAALDLEWAISEGRVYLLQCHAITRHR